MPTIQWQPKRIIILSLGTVFFTLMLYGITYLKKTIREMECSNEDSRFILKHLCDAYQSGELAGNLCSEICDYETIVFKHCLNYREGKKILLSMWNNKNIIIKSKRAHISDYRPIMFWKDDNSQYHPTEKEFEKMVRDTVTYSTGLKFPEKEDILTKFWSSNFHSFLNSDSKESMRKAAMNSLWSLVQQDEYVLYMSLQQSKHIPKIYGTCGHFYVIEYVPPGKVLGQALLESNEHWIERATVGLALLELIRSFEQDFKEPLHLCDVKGVNFGLDGKHHVKAIDTDMSFFSSKLATEFVDTGNCSHHGDCDFFDCKGWCVIPQNRCLSNRINNNLQVICEKIFISNMENAWSGILRSPPKEIKTDLQELLQECSNPGNVPNNRRYKAPWVLLNNLKYILRRSLL